MPKSMLICVALGWVSKPPSHLWFSLFKLDELVMSLRKMYPASTNFNLAEWITSLGRPPTP